MVVHGRFIAFDLACALLRRGHDVTLFTNYPKWAVERFGFPGSSVRSFWPHGLLTRAALKLHNAGIFYYRDDWFNPMFSRWASRELGKESWDVVNCWSGASEEILRDLAAGPLKLLIRGSSHILTQAKLLEDEQIRTGVRQERPSAWTIAREEREYRMADVIITISTFAQDTFIKQDLDPAKVQLMLLASSPKGFDSLPDIVEARRKRILSGEPLRVLYVGALSFRKGIYDLLATLKLLEEEIRSKRMSFRLVGTTLPEIESVLPELGRFAELVPKQRQDALPATYAWGDLFLCPTIEDGYAVVLSQASASGLPIMTTTNSGGPDLVSEGETGWILPIRSPHLFAERLRWCENNREELASMVHCVHRQHRTRGWDEVAADFETICGRRICPQIESQIQYAS
jgi:glycosyltransferase involved in cell wall biosynthesis